jgi:hypothetical protein
LKDAPADALVAALQRRGQSVENMSPDELRNSLGREVEQSKADAQRLAKRTYDERRQTLIKRSWKWGVQAAILAAVLAFIWRQSVWSRTP